MATEPQFEQKPKITPKEDMGLLREKIAESPERAQEIIKEHLKRKAEDIYLPGYDISKEKLSEIEKRIVDVGYEKEEAVIKELFVIVKEKGLLNAVKVAEKLPPSLADGFHDRLVPFLNEAEKKFENGDI